MRLKPDELGNLVRFNSLKLAELSRRAFEHFLDHVFNDFWTLTLKDYLKYANFFKHLKTFKTFCDLNFSASASKALITKLNEFLSKHLIQPSHRQILLLNWHDLVKFSSFETNSKAFYVPQNFSPPTVFIFWMQH